MPDVAQPLKFSQFGSAHGRLVIYFHGAPGAPEECRIFDLDGKDHDLTFICFDRFSIDPSISGEAYYQLLADEISRKAAGRQVDVVGFSIGAFVALQTCRYLPKKVRSLHLISAAAPLEAGDFLETMAGRQVFRLASTFPRLFMALSYWQGLLARFFPDALFRLLFSSAAGEDKALAATAEFRSGMTWILRSSFTGGIRGYARDIGAYVRPWKATLSGVSVETVLWHGADDNWSPKPMADYLKSAIPGGASVRIFDGLSHYSCLYRTRSELCDLLGKG